MSGQRYEGLKEEAPSGKGGPWSASRSEECAAGGQIRDRRERRVRAGTQRAGALAGGGHSPLEMTVGQSTGCLEASRSSSAAQGHILLSILGVGMGVGGAWKHLETRLALPCD